MRSKTVYMNGQSRGGTPGKATDTQCPAGRHKKDYYRVMVGFQGGEMAVERWKENGKRGYHLS